MEAKRRKRNVPRTSSRKHKLLETISIDIQGPFEHNNIDGTRMNSKAVDHYSGYVHTE
jgi:hypothetical protein